MAYVTIEQYMALVARIEKLERKMAMPSGKGLLQSEIERKVTSNRKRLHALHEELESVRLLSNLAYLFAIMAQDYQKAHKYVIDVVNSKSDKRDKVIKAINIVKQVTDTGLGIGAMVASCCGPQGVGATGGFMLAKAIISSAFKAFTTLSSELAYGDQNVDTIVSSLGLLAIDLGHMSANRDAINEAHGTDSLAKLKGGMGGRKTVHDDFVKSTSQGLNLFYTDQKDGKPTDPFVKFLELDTQLKQLAMVVRNTSGRDRKTLNNSIKQAIKKAVGNEEHYRVLVGKKSKAVVSAWDGVQKCMPLIMRRMVWRSYCRGKWGRRHDRYSVNISRDKLLLNRRKLERTPTEQWPYKVWKRDVIWPHYWNQIVTDFKDPDKGRDTENTHVSLAVVNCCQVRRYQVGGLLLDLAPVAAKEEGAGKIALSILCDPFKILTLNNKKILYQCRIKGGGQIEIFELRAGRRRKKFQLKSGSNISGRKTNTKGADIPLQVLRSERCSIMIKSAKRSWRHVGIRLFKKNWKNEYEEQKTGDGANWGKLVGDLYRGKHIESVNFATRRQQWIEWTPAEHGEYKIQLCRKYLQEYEEISTRGVSTKTQLENDAFYNNKHDFKHLEINETEWLIQVSKSNKTMQLPPQAPPKPRRPRRKIIVPSRGTKH